MQDYHLSYEYILWQVPFVSLCLQYIFTYRNVFELISKSYILQQNYIIYKFKENIG
jgi:hypothetical protein